MFSGKLLKESIPAPVRIFLLRAVVCFCVWQFLYQVFLKPERHLDKPVTYLTAFSTARVLSFAYGNSQIISFPYSETITVNGKRTINIADGCNALELFVLYVAFLICMPASNRRRVVFALMGIPAIYTLNILRCCAMAWLFMNRPQMVDFAHHYVFAVIVYGLIFWLLVRFSQRLHLGTKIPGSGS